MVKIGNNDPCHCGSGKKYQKCCCGKKPREQIVRVGSSEQLHGFHYDKEKMEVSGLTHDGDGSISQRFIMLAEIYY